MKKILMTLMTLCAVVLGALGLSGSAMAKVTCPTGSLHQGQLMNSAAECNLDNTQGTQELLTTGNKAINVAIGLVATIAVIVMIIGGVYFVISQGDANKITRARNTVLYGLIGLGIALLSYAIVNFVLKIF